MTKIVIGLAAVVVLIVVIVLLAMRYLRAEDSDPFEDFDDGPGQRGRGADDRDRRGVPQAAPARTAPSRPISPAFADHDQRAAEFPERADPRTTRRSRNAPPAEFDRQRQDARARAGGRQRAAEEDGDWPSTDWDSLSDVDYWAEVASDKPLTTTAQPAAQGRGGRADDRRVAESRPAQRAAAMAAPAREPRLPARAPDYLPAPTPAPRPRSGRPSRTVADEPTVVGQPSMASLNGSQRGPLPADDDPLTSPSFPRIAADSRSYRSGRIDTPPGGSRIDTPPGGSRIDTPPGGSRIGTPPGGSPRAAPYGDPAQQFPGPGSAGSGSFPGYGAADQPAGRWARPAAPDGYRDPADPRLVGYRPRPAAAADDRSRSAAAGPYGGYATPSPLDIPSGEHRVPGPGTGGYGGPAPSAPYSRPVSSRPPSGGHRAVPTAPAGQGGWSAELPAADGQHGPYLNGSGYPAAGSQRGHGAPPGPAGYLPGGYSRRQGGYQPGYSARPYENRGPEAYPADPYGYRGYGSASR